MLARVIASEAEAAFYEISGPEVFSKWYGESEQILRELFADAADQPRAIVFFDEIDSVASSREGSHEASQRVVAQLLASMDGFDRDSNVIVIAATNRPDDIDPALRRPGRFDWEIHFPLPDREDRESILRASSRHLVLQGPIPVPLIAANTEGWSAADLTAIWSEAALLAVADERSVIVAEDAIGGYERVGSQRRRTRTIRGGCTGVSLRSRWQGWRRRRRREKAAKDTTDAPLRECVYLDEVSVYSLLSSRIGALVTELTETETKSLTGEAEGIASSNVGIAKGEARARTEATSTRGTQVLRKSIVQTTFKELVEYEKRMTRSPWNFVTAS
ncbi:MAG: ATP-dependent zinc metalloprotease FtsH [Acidimicrobiales bacterium]|nr:MAG: 26S protease regulatory subunit [Actinomycetota bacterium]MBV6509973.1 ATP-dependent zinc metalloprotease FtsH [Acidimicrobiales bacterium]RIK08538.1 MAG: hypothetical protein DCC48_00920 [Acidobacteriota bacterium]